ncbi:MAG: MATE family efflux transporter, partial [Dehalococcoidales bacterium]|nr:MATE family efflux transporter [Dehalococcoidales bacterium]
MDIKLKENTKRLGYAPMGRLLLSLSLPGMASMMTIALYNIIDTFWLARLGYQPIAALTIVIPFYILAIAVSVGSGIGISALASRRFGERNIEATSMVAGQTFSLAGLLGIIFLSTAVFFTEPILKMSGATADIMILAKDYLWVIGFGMPFIFFMIMAGNLLRGSGDAFRPMIFMAIASVANIILDPFLIFGIGSFPEMGVRGAALATVTSQFLGAGLSFYWLVAKKSAYQIKLRNLKFNLPVLRDIYRVGLPSMILEVGESIAFALFNYILSAYGSLAIAAVGITIRITDLIFMPIFGVSHGLLPVVGYSFGAKLWKRLWLAVKLSSIGLAL